MPSVRRFFTSESVTEGHPDKVCDQISDAILDEFLYKDPNARVACEVTAFTGGIHVMGEITADCYVDIPKIVRDTIRKIGYTPSTGFDPDNCSVLLSIDEQSPDISMGVDVKYSDRCLGETGFSDLPRVCIIQVKNQVDRKRLMDTLVSMKEQHSSSAKLNCSGDFSPILAVIPYESIANSRVLKNNSECVKCVINGTPDGSPVVCVIEDIDKASQPAINNIASFIKESNEKTRFILTSSNREGISIPDYVSADAPIPVIELLPYQGAGDQGMMFGYACKETPELMPLPIVLAHRLCERLAKARKTEGATFLGPDGKAQVTVEYDKNGLPDRVEAIVVSTQHSETAEISELRKYIFDEVVSRVIPSDLIDVNTKIYINPTGRFVKGGPAADTGLTGRKIIVDTYGGYARHGGGAFSGKDPSKVDRSAAYAARWVAKNIVAAGIASKCEVQVSYAIGVAEPVSIAVDTFGTGVVSDKKISDIVSRVFDLRPAAIIERLCLKRPIYGQVASYGHFGRTNLQLPWEKTDRVEELMGELESVSGSRTVD